MKHHDFVQFVKILVQAGILLCLVKIAFGGPQQELEHALADLQQRPPEVRSLTRYLSLYSIPERERDQAVAAVGFVLNSLSRSAVIVPVERVSPTLIAFNLAAVAPKVSERQQWSGIWESLVGEEPYWHLSPTVILREGISDHNPDAGKKVVTDGPWLDPEMAAALRAETLSGGAIMRADWWLVKVTVPPFYYAFAGVYDNEERWLKQFGVDREVVKRLRGNNGANLIRSGVTHSVRRLFRSPAPTGGAVWITYDSRNRASVDAIRNPAVELEFDASEQIATRPNGLHKFAIFDGNGKRVDTVPPDIALDDSTYPTQPLQPMLSCVRCHVTDDGILKFKDVQSKLLSRETELTGDAEQIEELAAFYARQRRLQRFAERDREDYREAVLQSTGGIDLKTTVNALDRVTKRYRYELVSLTTAAGELGVSSDRLRESWKRSTDPILLALRSDISVDRSQFETSFAEAAILAQEQNQ